MAVLSIIIEANTDLSVELLLMMETKYEGKQK